MQPTLFYARDKQNSSFFERVTDFIVPFMSYVTRYIKIFQ